jgi:hypothetical protein
MNSDFDALRTLPPRAFGTSRNPRSCSKFRQVSENSILNLIQRIKQSDVWVAGKQDLGR